ncbi:MAG: SPASM domain-containing protein [Candidatus Heimdallarchaeota archaeon]|nr:SPASM domain-containing protein [Candidatus Heimdallarchaeota archaeon]
MAVVKIISNYEIDFLTKLSQNQNYELSENDKIIIKKYGLLGSSHNITHNKDEIDFISDPIVNITLNVIQECNLNCIYCYGDKGKYGLGGKMPLNTAFKTVDWLIQQSKNKEDLSIGFFGGEPMLNFELIKKVVKYSTEQGKLKGKKFEYSINTNGTLLNKDAIFFFKKHKVKILVSLDGDKVIQDGQRPFKNGKGSYDIIKENVRRLLKEIPGASCRATIVGDMCIENIDKALKEVGFNKSHINFVSPTLFNDKNNLPTRNLKIMVDAIEKEVYELLESIKKKNIPKITTLKDSGQVLSIVAQFINSQSRLFPCGAGRGYVAISTDGGVYLCHRFVGDEYHKLGTIFSNIEKSKYLKSPIKREGKCLTCFSKYICGGGCYHDNLSNTGSIFEGSNDSCNFIRKVVEYGAYVASELTIYDKIFLVEAKIIDKKPCLLDLF